MGAVSMGTLRRAELPIDMRRTLQRFVMVPTNEIGIEGKHALAKCRLNRRGTHKPTPQRFSSELRFVAFDARSGDPAAFETMLEHLESGRETQCFVFAVLVSAHAASGRWAAKQNWVLCDDIGGSVANDIIDPIAGERAQASQANLRAACHSIELSVLLPNTGCFQALHRG